MSILSKPGWWERHPLVVPLSLLLSMTVVVTITKPGRDSWWTVHHTLLWVGAVIVIALYLVLRYEIWRLIWGGRTIEQIETDVHDHIRSLERRVDRLERTPTAVRELATLKEG